MKDRVAVVGPHPPFRGGIAHFNERFSDALVAAGRTVDRISFSRQYPGLLFPGESQFEPDARSDTATALPLLDSLNPLSWRSAAHTIARRGSEVVVLAYWLPFFAPCLGAVARRLHRRGIPAIALVHNAVPHESRPLDRLLTRRFLKAVNGALVLSEAVEADVRALAPQLPVVRTAHPTYGVQGTPTDRTLAREALGLQPEDEVVLFFGFVRPYKGLDVLLDAFPSVLARRPQTRLVVAGEFYDPVEPYRRQMEGLGIEDRVILHPRYIPAGEVARYFAAADVVAQPYRTATQSGVARLAFGHGRPMIVTDVGGLAEAVPHERAGLVVAAKSPVELADAIVRFFAESLSDRLSEGARETAAAGDWKATVAALDRLVDDISDIRQS